MGTSREEISRWFDVGVNNGATHMIVATDTFDYSDYPIYVFSSESVSKQVEYRQSVSMSRVMEVYDLSMDKQSQLNEQRAWHLESASTTGDVIKEQLMKSIKTAKPIKTLKPESKVQAKSTIEVGAKVVCGARRGEVVGLKGTDVVVEWSDGTITKVGYNQVQLLTSELEEAYATIVRKTIAAAQLIRDARGLADKSKTTLYNLHSSDECLAELVEEMGMTGLEGWSSSIIC